MTVPERTPAPEDGAAARIVADVEQPRTIEQLAARLLRHHPLQYGYRPSGDDEPVFDPPADVETVERYSRCPTCEQWSPCDVRLMLAHIASLTADLAASRAEVGTERRLNEQHQAALDQAERERDEARAILLEGDYAFERIAEHAKEPGWAPGAVEKWASLRDRSRAALARGGVARRGGGVRAKSPGPLPASDTGWQDGGEVRTGDPGAR